MSQPAPNSQPEQRSFFADALRIIEDRGNIDRRSLARGVVVIVAVVIIGVTFAWSYVGALHQPTFHKVPIAVVGPPALQKALNSGPEFSVTTERSPQAAISRIDAHNAFGGVVVGSRGIEVLVASVASRTVSSVLSADLPPKLRAVAPPNTPIRVLDLKPAPPNDPLGLSPFYLALAVVVSNYVGAVLFGLAFGVKPVGRRVWWRLLGTGILGLILGLSEVGVVNAVGPLQGHYVTLVLASVLLGLAVSTITVGLASFLGIAGTTVAILIFVVLGNPASGGPLPTQLLPGFWGTIGPYLPVGAGTDLIRNIAYFGGNSLTRPLIVLFAWVFGGTVLALASFHVRALGLQFKPDFDRQAAARHSASQA